MHRTLAVLIALLAPIIASAADSPADPGSGHQRMLHHVKRMSFLDNGVVKLGVDLNLGGSITYLSPSGRDMNLVNNYDFGRQVQMSYYSGPAPFQPPGKAMRPEWSFIGWNPIQVGDAFGNPSKILDGRNDGKELYVKCVPMHWPLDNAPGECTFETWLTLDGPVVHARCRFQNDRPDHTQYAVRGQELPAVYTNGPWYRLMTYDGEQPFTGAPLTRIEKKGDRGPWSHWSATENWAALVDDAGFGLGVFEPGVVSFSGGFAGKPGAGGPDDSPTGYIAPNSREVIDWNVVHEYRYDLIVGTVAQIRRYAFDHAVRPSPPAYRFENARNRWYYINAEDSGLPIKGGLNVRIEKEDPQIISPIGFWKAEDAGTIVIEAACHSARGCHPLLGRPG